MKPEQAAALRAPFPPDAIGWLPKGGTMLSYVGHAAVCDRLLQVDPDWTWEPPTSDELQRLPNGDGMWIKLTVGGVTRFGWGDGKNIKEWISDAIRNAAMRFGVALDLWSKEDLRHEDAGAERATDATQTRTQAPAPATSPPLESARSGPGNQTPLQASDEAPPVHPPTSSVPGPSSKNRVGKLQSRLKMMQTDGFRVAKYRDEAGLPPLNAECTTEQLDAWEALLELHDKNLERTNA